MSDYQKLREAIRDVPDFPEKGILFKDITPLLSDSELCGFVIEESIKKISRYPIDAVAGIESRGFLFGLSLAQRLGAAFLPVRKKGKLPYETVSMSYQLEYGQAEIEMHKDAISPGMNIHVHDDLIATGGTAAAVSKLIEEQGAVVSSYSFIIELSELNGRKNLESYCNNIDSLLVY